MPHQGKRGMTSVDQVFALLDEDDENTSDIKDLTSVTPVSSSYSSPGRYSTPTPRLIQRPQEDQTKRQRVMENDNIVGHIGKNSYSRNSASSTATSANLSMKQRDVSEYNYAQALLKQASKLSSSRDLDRSSVFRLAQAYITLQHGLQSWESCGNQTRWWPPNVDGGELALAAQQTMSCFVLIITSKGNVVYISDAVEALLGHDQLNLVGRSVESLVPPEELSVFAEQFSSLTGSSRGGCAERSFYTRMLNARRSGLQHQRFELVHAVGHIQEVALASHVSSSAGQRETWLMCACRVMAPQLENEGSSSPCTEWVSHNALDGIIIYMDARSCQVSGYLPNEVLGLSPYCFVHLDDQEYVAFSHNQALINVGGSSCTYRMYTSSQDVVYVHSSFQLARDKHTNQPKFLFCLHRLVEDEHEGIEQVLRHQQELMWAKSDPSIKYSMTDIERTVKALQLEGSSSPLVMSRGGMKTSVLTDSCAADGGDLLAVNLSNHMQVPVMMVQKQEPGLSTAGAHCQQQGAQNFYTSAGSQYQRPRSQMSTALSSAGADYGGSYGYDGGIGRPMQQQQQQQHMYNRQLSQQQMYSNIQQQYEQQMLLNSSNSTCQTVLPSSSSDSPVSGASTGSFVDYLFDTAGQPTDGQLMYNTDSATNQSIISPTGRGRGRSRTRGRPRGSGRGGRGVTRGVRGTRISRGRGSRGRGRAGAMTQISQSHELLGNVRQPESLMSQGSLSPISIHGSMSPRSSLSPMAGSGDHLFMSPDSGMGLQRSSTVGNISHQQMTSGRSRMDIQQMTSGGSRINIQQMTSNQESSSQHLHSGNMADLQQIHSDNMFQRMSSLDGIDMLDPSQEFSLHQTTNLEMTPRTWAAQEQTPSIQVSPYRTIPSSDHMPGKRVGRPRGSRNQLERQQHFQRTVSIDDQSIPSHLEFGPNQQSSLYGRDSPYHSRSPSSASYPVDSSRGTGGASNVSYQSQAPTNSVSSSVQGQGSFQRSLSFQGAAGGRMAPDTDPEHSILGNLLKGRAGSRSSTGSKSPAQTGLTSIGRSPGHSIVPDRNGKSPLTQPAMCDRGGRSPAHSLISEAMSPVSVFSPDSSRATPSVIKDEPEVISTMDESNYCPLMFGSSSPSQSQQTQQQQQQQQHDDILNFVLDQGEHKNPPEMQLFTTQLRQKHHSLKQSFISQDSVIHQLESSIQQTAKDSNAEALCVKLNLIKANKNVHEKELRVIQAKLEAQVQQHQLQQRQPPQQQQQQQHHGLQQHRLTSPAATNTRRMAIVPPLQRQPTEEDLNPILSQASPGDLKAGQSGGGIQQSTPDVGAKLQQPAPGSSTPETGTKSNPALMITAQQPNSRTSTQETSARGDASFCSAAPPQSANQQLQPPQQSPFSLHHHHHHHHHYHHHALPQQHINLSSSLKETPPPAYGSYDSSVYSASSVAVASVTPGPLSISVSSTTTSLASPIICETSPVSVDESPSCASDASSGYHSLSHNADTLPNICGAPFNMPHCVDIASTSAGPTFSSKTPPTYDQSMKSAGKSPDMIPSSVTHISNNLPIV